MEMHANVERAVINEELSEGKSIVADIYFKNMRRIFQDLPQIAESVEFRSSLSPTTMRC